MLFYQILASLIEWLTRLPTGIRKIFWS